MNDVETNVATAKGLRENFNAELSTEDKESIKNSVVGYMEAIYS
jgi:hypothetical protein